MGCIVEPGWVKNGVRVHQSLYPLYIGRKECRGTLFPACYKGGDVILNSVILH